MADRFAKVSGEETKEAFFYIPSRLGIYPPLFTTPSEDSCILF